MSAPITLTLPLPENKGNERGHWAVRDRKRTRYLKACDERQNCGLIPRPPRFPLSGVEIRATLYCWSLSDDDNATARLKHPLDWLKTRGYIVDDTRAHCRIPTPEQVIDRKNQRLVLTISPL